MKKVQYIIKTVGLAACVGVSVTSCDLDLLPLNEVVLENFWTDKSDVESVLNSCYTGMCESDWMTRAIVWGEIRSENVDNGPSGGGMPQYIQYINKGVLKQTNAACDWTSFYTVINRCNTVIKFATDMYEEERDPNFTPDDYRQVIAQAKGIRALNYFYLIRTFGNVPFSFEPSIDDTQNYRIAATKFNDVLDALIADIEECKDDAPRVYTTQTSSNKYRLNSGRITSTALKTLLADMYMWRASDAKADDASRQRDYRRCIELCDEVMDFKYKQYDEDVDHTLQRKMDQKVLTAFNYPMLSERDATSTGSNPPAAYNAIFGEGNSWESIFEISFGTANDDQKNTTLAYMYGGKTDGGSTQQYVTANSNLMLKKIDNNAKQYDNSKLFSVSTDYRSLTGFRFSESGTSYDILKYSVDRFQGGDKESLDRNFGEASTTAWKAGSSKATDLYRSYRNSYAGWIVYRLSDVILLRAEAELELAGMMQPECEMEDLVFPNRIAKHGSDLTEAKDLYEDAFKLISMNYLRSNPDQNVAANSTYCPKLSNFQSYTEMYKLLENERHREFLFEGKRYYDLVRIARRDGSTAYLKSAVSSKFGDASRMILIRMAKLEFVFMPYAEKQLEVNPNLYYDVDNPNLAGQSKTARQNPAYAEDEDITKS